MDNNLVQKAVSAGGKLAPLVISHGLTSGTGLMNPSVFIDDDGDILVNLRHVNYTLYHSENTQQFPSRWGPLTYAHPETDMALRTTNYICRLDGTLSMTNYALVDTATLDVTPLWEFTGQEDCRLVKWDGKYFNIGVRRDVDTIGTGRMELSELSLDKDSWEIKEVSRNRIPTPPPNDSYCEKNWMPILDRPYQFVKWTAPTEVVEYHPLEQNTSQVTHTSALLPPADQRGGSQVIRWGDHYLAITHEVNLFNNYLSQKDGIYRHRVTLWDNEFNLVGVSKTPFTFLDARIEFAAGVAKYEDDLLISFGFQDNAAFILRVPKLVVDELVEDALTYES
jgi:hypothetical protein